MSRPVRIAVAGLGRFGTLHLRTFADMSVHVAAVCDPDPDRLHAVKEEFGVAHTYASLDELLAGETVDLVDVVTDEASHGQLVLHALDAGCHVFVEKPLTLDPEEAERILERARTARRTVLVGQISRFAAGYGNIKDALTAGELGSVVNLRFRRDFSRSWFPAFGSRVHPVWESGIHDIDLAVWFAGAPCQTVYAVARSVSGMPYPETLTAVLTFTNGVVATVESGWLIPDAAPQTLRGALELDGTIDATTEVLGAGGMARYRLAHDGLSVWTDQSVAHPEVTLWPTVGGRVGGALRDELSYTLDVVRGLRRNDLMPLQEAVEGVRIAAAVQAATAKGEAVHLRGEGDA